MERIQVIKEEKLSLYRFAVSLRPVFRQSSSYSQSVALNADPGVSFETRNKWNLLSVYGMLSFWPLKANNDTCSDFQLSQVISGTFNHHVHIAYEWNVQTEDVTDTNHVTDDEVSKQTASDFLGASPEFSPRYRPDSGFVRAFLSHDVVHVGHFLDFAFAVCQVPLHSCTSQGSAEKYIQ